LIVALNLTNKAWKKRARRRFVVCHLVFTAVPAYLTPTRVNVPPATRDLVVSCESWRHHTATVTSPGTTQRVSQNGVCMVASVCWK